MYRQSIVTAISAVVLVLSTTAHAQKAEFGTADEAKAMLEKVVAGMKADPAKTIGQINKGELRDRDLYPTCAGPDGPTSGPPRPAGKVAVE